MNTSELKSIININNSSLYKLIAYSIQKKFNGKINLSSSSGIEWQFYFFLGKLTWIDGGIHSNRIWLRHIIRYFSEINVDSIQLKAEEKYECYQYQIVKIILTKKLVEKEAIEKMLFSRTKEIFYDIFYEENKRKLGIKAIPMTTENLCELGFEPFLIISNLKEILEETLQEYSSFIQQSGVGFSFNYAPLITDKAALKHEVPEHIYHTFIKYFNGQNTIKSLAFKLDKDSNKLALSILPYLKKKTIKLLQLDDLPPYATVDRYFSETNFTNIQIQKNAIACIDDSPLICKMMNTIVNKVGHQFIGINEPLQAIPQLIQAKPSLIFVDLAMPLINGYEVCNQIKKISQLKETPIVMLTGRDFMAERVKAKVVGISDFIGKPIVEDKIISAIEKYAK